MEDMQVSEVMSLMPVTCRLEHNLDYVARILSDAEVSAIIVVDEEEKPLGVVSQYDLLKYYGKEISKINVSKVMSKKIESIEKNDSVQKAVDIMLKENINRLLVLDENKTRIEGVISRTDIIRTMRLSLEDQAFTS
ncbi:HPP family protein [Chloroflexota bacterium]